MTKLIKYVGLFTFVILACISNNPSAAKSYFLAPDGDQYYEHNKDNNYVDSEELLNFLSDILNEDQLAGELSRTQTKRNSDSNNNQEDNDKWFEYLADKKRLFYPDIDYTYEPDMDIYRKEADRRKLEEYYYPSEESDDGFSTWNDLLLSKFLRDRDFDQRLLMMALLEDVIDDEEATRNQETDVAKEDIPPSLEKVNQQGKI